MGMMITIVMETLTSLSSVTSLTFGWKMEDITAGTSQILQAVAPHHQPLTCPHPCPTRAEAKKVGLRKKMSEEF
jgi:hypothetical protein